MYIASFKRNTTLLGDLANPLMNTIFHSKLWHFCKRTKVISLTEVYPAVKYCVKLSSLDVCGIHGYLPV